MVLHATAFGLGLPAAEGGAVVLDSEGDTTQRPEMSLCASSFCAAEPSLATSCRISRAPSLSPISRYALASSSLVPTPSEPASPGVSRLRSARSTDGEVALTSDAADLELGKSRPDRSKSKFAGFSSAAGSLADADGVPGARSKSIEGAGSSLPGLSRSKSVDWPPE